MKDTAGRLKSEYEKNEWGNAIRSLWMQSARISDGKMRESAKPSDVQQGDGRIMGESVRLFSKFYFYVDSDANVVRIDKEEDCKWLPKRKIFGAAEQQMWEYIDFEECVRQGIEAVEYCYSAAHASQEQGEKMDRLMFG